MKRTMIDLFAGYGGFRLGFEKAGAECIGHCEIDKYANLSYKAIFGEKEGAWFARDIKGVDPGELPQCDIVTGGFPCQDCSVAGRGAGLFGERSSLFFEIIRLLEGKNREDKPRWVILENVKNLIHIDAGEDFTTVLLALSEVGYDCEYQILNSKDFGVPQNRERCYIIGHLRGRCRGKVFPITGADTAPLIQLIAGRQGSRVYDPSGSSCTLTSASGGMGGKTGYYAVDYSRKHGIGCEIDTAHALNASNWRGINRNQQQTAVFVDLTKSTPQLTDTARCLKRCYNAGMTNRKGDNSGVLLCPILTPDRESKRQNGRRVKEHGEPMFTLTQQDRHGLLMKSVESGEVRIRRLTPRECFRLQSVDDELFDRIRLVCSDTQLYKQAGNGVTVNVVYEIAKKLMECEAI